MSTLPWTVYGAALDARQTLTARHADGDIEQLQIERWLADADPVDERLIDRARGPVLDVGCGPGRHVHALVRRGVSALGLDASPSAIRIASERGAEAVLGDVFDHGLELGVWETVLLLDGNLGIGGDPARLLCHVRDFLTPTGRILIETDAPGGEIRRLPLRLEGASDVSLWFPWARVPANRIADVAGEANLHVASSWDDDGRWFAELACA